MYVKPFNSSMVITYNSNIYYKTQKYNTIVL